MTVSSYSNFFSLFIFGIFMIPAVILGLLGKKTKKIGINYALKRYGMIISIPMMVLLFGLNSKQMIQFVAFILYEVLLVYIYYCFKKRVNSEFVYYTVFSLSMLPILIVKAVPVFFSKILPLVSPLLSDRKICISADKLSFLGFIGISYISFRIWQMIIEIHDDKIKEFSLPEMLYFITFFPTITSGPIDRYQRFKKDLEAEIETKDYIINYLFVGIKKIFIGALYKFALATFNKPFLAHNMKEFWDRWHMSLSKWFGDYLFSRFVLNSLRNGTFKSKKTATRCGYMLTMFTMGLWHGFYLFYIAYGIYQGLMLVLTDIYVKSKTYRKFKKSKYYDAVSIAACFHVVSFGMLLFSGYLFNF